MIRRRERLSNTFKLILLILTIASSVSIAIINYVVMYNTLGFITDFIFFPHVSMIIPAVIGGISFITLFIIEFKDVL